MTVGYDVLKPYKSLILAQISEGHVPEIVVEPVILGFKSLLNIDANPDLDIVTEGTTTPFELTPPGLIRKGPNARQIPALYREACTRLV